MPSRDCCKGYQNFPFGSISPIIGAQTIPTDLYRGALVQNDATNPDTTVQMLLGFDQIFYAVLTEPGFPFVWRTFSTTAPVPDLVVSVGVSRTRLIWLEGRASDGALQFIETANGASNPLPLTAGFTHHSIGPVAAVVQDSAGDLMLWDMTPDGHFQLRGHGGLPAFEFGPRVLANATSVAPASDTVNGTTFVPQGVGFPWADTVDWYLTLQQTGAIGRTITLLQDPADYGGSGSLFRQYPRIGTGAGELQELHSAQRQVIEQRAVASLLETSWDAAVVGNGADVFMNAFHLCGWSGGMCA